MKKLDFSFRAELQQLDSGVWYYAVRVPDNVATAYREAKTKRIECTVNEVHTFQCAFTPVKTGEYFINLNKEIRTKLRIQLGDEVTLSIRPDESKYGLPMPEEFQALLDIDEEGSRVFHSLMAGKQRTLLHLIGKPKSEEIRIKKAMVVNEYLKEVNGKLDFKELNHAFKDANRTNCLLIQYPNP